MHISQGDNQRTSADRARVSPLLELRHLSMTYSTKSGEIVPALFDISASFGSGDFVTIVGPSGCGKSTLLKLIAGIMPSCGGDIHFDGVQLTKPTEHIG